MPKADNQVIVVPFDEKMQRWIWLAMILLLGVSILVWTRKSDAAERATVACVPVVVGNASNYENVVLPSPEFGVQVWMADQLNSGKRTRFIYIPKTEELCAW